MPLASMSKVTSTCGDTAGRGGDPGQLEAAERLVVCRHRPLALKHMNLHFGLAVCGGSEDLAATGRDGRVALDHLRAHSALGLHSKRQWGHVEQENALHVTLQDARLDGGTQRYDLIRVDALMGILAGQLLDKCLNGWHASRATHQDHVVDVLRLHACILDRLLEWLARAFDKILGHLLELGPGELLEKVNRALIVGRDERQVDLGLGDG